MGLYLQARSSIEILDEYNGESGFFIKTFGLNTKRNKNGWRVSWESIDKRIQGYADQNLPGILYTKCTQAGCDLDHTDAATYESSLNVQEPFRVTDIVDTVKDEDNLTGYAIHRITTPHDDITQEDLDQFKQDIIEGKIQFVSPSVWPISGQYDIKHGERMPNGEPIIDAYDWLPLHIAFVNDPAFGDEARVTATCEGADCQVKLLTARQLSAYNENHDADGRFGTGDNPDDSESSSNDDPSTDTNTKLDTTPDLENAISSKQSELATSLEKSHVPQEEMDKIMSPLSRTTDPDSSYGSTVIQKAWDDAIKEHPELQDDRDKLEKFQDDVNAAIADKFANTNTLYRGTTTDELDDIVEKGSVEPYNYNFVSMTMDKDAGMGFGKNASDVNGVTLELDKENIANQKLWNGEPMVIQPVKYSMYADHAGHGEELDGQYPISFADEMEVRSYQFKSDAIKSITVHQSEYMNKSEANAIVKTYSDKMQDVEFNIKKEGKSVSAKTLTAAPVFQTQTVIFRLAGNHAGPDDCDDYADQEFDINDVNMPQLPIHENCECYYEDKQSGENLGQLNSRTLIARASDVSPVLIRHKNHLHFASVTRKMHDDIQSEITKNGKLDSEQLPEIFKNNSFSACTCSTLRMADPTPEQLKASLKAAEKDSADKGDKIKELESKIAEMKGAIAACGKCGSTKHTSENHTDENDGDGVEDSANAKTMKAITAKLSTYEKKITKPMIEVMLKARETLGVPADEIAALEKSLSAKSLEEIESIYNNEQVFLKAATVENKPEETGLHAPFNGATTGGSLNGKTLEEIAGERS